MTAFFVTLSRRPISLAQIPSFHHVMSAAVRSGVHSCVTSLCSRPILARRTVPPCDTNREDNTDSSLYNIPHTVHEQRVTFPETAASKRENVRQMAHPGARPRGSRLKGMG